MTNCPFFASVYSDGCSPSGAFSFSLLFRRVRPVQSYFVVGELTWTAIRLREPSPQPRGRIGRFQHRASQRQCRLIQRRLPVVGVYVEVRATLEELHYFQDGHCSLLNAMGNVICHWGNLPQHHCQLRT